MMRIGGQEINGPNEVTLVLPRETGDIVIKARAVMNLAEFEAKCPLPQAPGIRDKNGHRPNTDDPTYKQMMNDYNLKKFHYIFLVSLIPSDIEWDSVNMDDPSTWGNWMDDFEKCGISGVEANRVVTLVKQANSLDEDKLKEARENFLLGTRAGQ